MINVSNIYSILIQLSTIAGLEFFETSAKENISVKAVFERLVDIICDKMSESLDADASHNTSSIHNTRQLSEVQTTHEKGCHC